MNQGGAGPVSSFRSDLLIQNKFTVHQGYFSTDSLHGRLGPETAVKAALWLLAGTSLPGLRELILALDGKVARRPAAGTRALHMVSAFLVLCPGNMWT